MLTPTQPNDTITPDQRQAKLDADIAAFKRAGGRVTRAPRFKPQPAKGIARA